MKDNIKSESKIIIYTDKHGNVELKADVEKETIWATQAQIAELFNVNSQAITKHLKNIFKSKELLENLVCSKMEHTAQDGKQYKVNFYNLDAIIAVGYRVNSKKATQFRIWATKTLCDYIVKGFVANVDRIKQLPDKILKDLDEKIKFISLTVISA